MAGNDAPTGKQLDWVKRLLDMHEWQSETDPARLNATATLSTLLNTRIDIANGETGEQYGRKIARQFNEQTGSVLNRRTISSLIDYLRGLPGKGTTPASDEAQIEGERRPKGSVGIPWDNVKRQIKEAGRKTSDGFYQLPDGRIYKVVLSENGHLYAKKMHVIADAVWQHGELVRPAEIEWIWEEGAMRNIRPEYKMNEEQARRYGKLYGRCYECNRKLRNELSIHLGIGPVCGGREFGGQFVQKVYDAEIALGIRNSEGKKVKK